MNNANDALERAKRLSNFLNREVDDLSSPRSEREKAAYCLLHIALEHFEATIILVERGKLASARALMRPCWDAHIRGVWLKHCASDVEFGGFKAGKMPHQHEMGRAVYDSNDASVALPTKESRTSLHSFVHGGIEQICQFAEENLNGEIAVGTESVNLLRHSSAVATLAAHSLADLCCAVEAASAIQSKAVILAATKC